MQHLLTTPSRRRVALGRAGLWWAALTVGLAGVGAAQAPPADSLRVYDLAEIVVAAGGEQARTPTTVQRVGLAEIVRQDAASVAEAARLIPAGFVTTNSRGETLLYLRNAGERGVGVFLDGALLNVPWDYRVDLGLLPAGVVGGMTVAKGVPSVLYGTNVLGGAVNLVSRALDAPGAVTEATIRAGTGGARSVQGVHLRARGGVHATLAAGLATREGLPLPDDADLPFSQRGDRLRTNTDRRLAHAFGRVAWTGGPAQLAVTVLHTDAAQGVAPESHLDPAVASVRYWRYPRWRTSMLVANAALPGGLRATVWGSRFTQHIDAYASAAYTARIARQEDLDRTLGARVTAARAAGPGTLRLALNALTSSHDQTDRAPEEAAPDARATYRAHLFSAGAEYEAPFRLGGRDAEAVAGASVDGFAAPETALQPGFDPLLALGLTSGVVVDLRPGLAVRASAGRKVRFPTMRERYDVALGRFVLNPDLGPETAWIGEAALVLAGARVSGEAVVFGSRTAGTIDQERIEVDGERVRRRVNLDGGHVVGVEVAGAAALPLRVRLDGHLTWTHTRGRVGGTTRPLEEKPAWTGLVTLARTAPGGLSVALSGACTGGAYGRTAAAGLAPLPDALVLGGRAGYRRVAVRARRTYAAEVFVHLDNLTDAVVLPQPGLPGAGRSVRVGLDFAF